jgi:hypothetical protein
VEAPVNSRSAVPADFPGRNGGPDGAALIGPRSIEILDHLDEGRHLDEVSDCQPGWGYPSERDRADIAAIMSATDEPESETEGPPETSEDGIRADDAAGEMPER